MRKDKIPALIVFVIGSGFLIYFIYGFVPELFLRFDNSETTGQVIGWEKEDAKNYILFVYKHPDGHQYTIRKEIKRPKIDQLKDKKQIIIKYSNLFPGYTLIDGIPDRSYIFFPFGIAIMVVALYRSIQVFRGKIRPEDFYLTGK